MENQNQKLGTSTVTILPATEKRAELALISIAGKFATHIIAGRTEYTELMYLEDINFSTHVCKRDGPTYVLNLEGFKGFSKARDEFANVNNKVHTAIFELLEPTFRDQVLLNLGYNKDLSFPEVMTLIRSLLPKGNIITELIANLEALSIQDNDLHKFISTARVFVYNNKKQETPLSNYQVNLQVMNKFDFPPGSELSSRRDLLLQGDTNKILDLMEVHSHMVVHAIKKKNVELKAVNHKVQNSVQAKPRFDCGLCFKAGATKSNPKCSTCIGQYPNTFHCLDHHHEFLAQLEAKRKVQKEVSSIRPNVLETVDKIKSYTSNVTLLSLTDDSSDPKILLKQDADQQECPGYVIDTGANISVVAQKDDNVISWTTPSSPLLINKIHPVDKEGVIKELGIKVLKSSSLNLPFSVIGKAALNAANYRVQLIDGGMSFLYKDGKYWMLKPWKNFFILAFEDLTSVMAQTIVKQHSRLNTIFDLHVSRGFIPFPKLQDMGLVNLHVGDIEQLKQMSVFSQVANAYKPPAKRLHRTSAPLGECIHFDDQTVPTSDFTFLFTVEEASFFSGVIHVNDLNKDTLVKAVKQIKHEFELDDWHLNRVHSDDKPVLQSIESPLMQLGIKSHTADKGRNDKLCELAWQRVIKTIKSQALYFQQLTGLGIGFKYTPQLLEHAVNITNLQTNSRFEEWLEINGEDFKSKHGFVPNCPFELRYKKKVVTPRCCMGQVWAAHNGESDISLIQPRGDLVLILGIDNEMNRLLVAPLSGSQRLRDMAPSNLKMLILKENFTEQIVLDLKRVLGSEMSLIDTDDNEQLYLNHQTAVTKQVVSSSLPNQTTPPAEVTTSTKEYGIMDFVAEDYEDFESSPQPPTEYEEASTSHEQPTEFTNRTTINPTTLPIPHAIPTASATPTAVLPEVPMRRNPHRNARRPINPNAFRDDEAANGEDNDDEYSIFTILSEHPVELQESKVREMRQFIENNVFTPVDVKLLAKTEHERVMGLAMNSIMLSSVKKEEPLEIKSRLVANGATQRDHPMKASKTPAKTTIFTALAVSVQSGFTLDTFDVHGAFLTSIIDREEYVILKSKEVKILQELFPKKYDHLILRNGTMLVELNKAMYGIVQAPFLFYSDIRDLLLKHHYIQSKVDGCLFFKFQDGQLIDIITVHVDDLLHGHKFLSLLAEQLETKYKIKRFNGQKLKYLGLELDYTKDKLQITANDYADKLTKDVPMPISPILTPMSTDQMLETTGLPQYRTTEKEKKWYIQKLMGAAWLAIWASPRLATTVSYLSQFMHGPEKHHCAALMRMLQYIKTTRDSPLIFTKTNDEEALRIIVSADASFHPHKDAKSHTGFIVQLGNSATIATYSGKQKVVKLAASDAELTASIQAINVGLKIDQILTELGIANRGITCMQDNQAAIEIAKKGSQNGKAAWLNVQYALLADLYEKGILKLVWTPTKLQRADVLTKPMWGPQFKDGLQPIYDPASHRHPQCSAAGVYEDAIPSSSSVIVPTEYTDRYSSPASLVPFPSQPVPVRPDPKEKKTRI